jgi:hypothetical protein
MKWLTFCLFYTLNLLAGELGQEVGGAGGAAHAPRLFGQRITLQADSLALPSTP